MLHTSETWPLTKTNLQRLQRYYRAMIRQIGSIEPEDVTKVRSSELLRTPTSFLEREGFAGLGMWSILVVQLMADRGGGCREVQTNMQETDGERLL